MRRNLSELEQRLIILLKKNSRMSIVDIAKELGISRLTAKRVFDSLISTGRIKKFTILLEEEESNISIVHVNNLDNVPENLVLERFDLIDGTYLLIMYYEDLPKLKNTNIKRVEIATSRHMNEDLIRMENFHCDYCGKEIKDSPIKVEINGRSYYVCCRNCERDIKKRIELMLREG